jgi:hypothetical protein
MKMRITFFAGLAALLLLSGCLPEQKVIWSSDGKQAVVLAEAGALYLCDSDGTLSEPLLDDVLRVAWLSDSSRLVMARMVEFTSWEQVSGLLAPTEREELVALADTFHEVYLEKNNLASAAEMVLDPANLSDEQEELMGLYFKARYPDLVVREKLEEEHPLSAEVVVIETAVAGKGTLQLKQRVAATAFYVWDLRVAPNGLAVAYTSGEVFDDDAAPSNLFLASLDEMPDVRRIATNVALFPDWSVDGQYLVYAEASGETDRNKLQLGSIARCKVANRQGNLLEKVGERDDLAGIIMSELTRVRTLPDGSIVFATLEVKLPSAVGDMPENMNLFKINPETQAIVSRLLPRTAESHFSEWSMLFEPSPDGRKLAFIDAENRVVVVTIATGELWHVPDSDSETFLPSWRGSSELSFFCTASGAEGGEERMFVARFSTDKESEAVELSASWPEEILKSFSD